jgi:hypothetical protein
MPLFFLIGDRVVVAAVWSVTFRRVGFRSFKPPRLP